jgi:hypothetical protein
MKTKTTYTVRINEINEGGDESAVLVVECQMNANGDDTAAAVMSDLLLSVAKHNNIGLHDLNANLYKTQWINGI